MLNYNTAYKYEMTYKVPYVITQCLTNDTVSLKIGVTEIRYNINRIKPYKYDTKLEDISSKNMSNDFRI